MFGIAVTLIFLLPIIKVITKHFENKEQIKGERVKIELELEKLKYENFVIETEKQINAIKLPKKRVWS